jgi:2-polyprenyl-3-methyl-5-hydroxy-6-metoxy-1,4-benzoquinol methylase
MKNFWNDTYRVDNYVYGTDPNEFLRCKVHYFPPQSKILVAGGGEGRDAVWLAKRGFEVTSVDFSEQACTKCRRLAKAQDVVVQIVCTDLLSWSWPIGEFGGIVLSYLHLPGDQRRPIHKHVVGALSSSGIVVLEAFHRQHAQRALTNKAALGALFYTPVVLADDFLNVEILELVTQTIHLQNGSRHNGYADVIRMVARKK